MNKYILVRVLDGSTVARYSTDLAVIRKAIHQASEEYDIPVSDMVTHSLCMTDQESDIVSKVFEGALNRVKYNAWLSKTSEPVYPKKPVRRRAS